MLRWNTSGPRTLWLVVGLSIVPSWATARQAELEDSEIERCLIEGEMLKGAESLDGVTRPLKIDIECDGSTYSAVFKSIDEHRRGVTRLQGAGAEMNFSDDFRYERAAYLLDRELGLHMVPVAVLRSRRGDDGALVFWIENASQENEMPARPTGPQMAELTRQKQLMYLFDALIENTDRRLENWLIDNDDWSLYLIDHSRAFRTDDTLTEDFLERRSRLTRDLYDRLQALNQADLELLLQGLLNGNQIEALLARRDEIIAKIDRDREEYGDEMVFSE